MISIRVRSRLAILLGVALTSTATAEIKLVGQLSPAPGSYYGDVWGDGDYAYLGSATFGTGVYIIDISDPAQPTVVAEYNPLDDFFLQDVKVQDGIGYFASNSGGFVHLVDLSDPTNPVKLSRIDVPNAHNISVLGDRLYVAPGFGGVFAYDVSNPSAPSLIQHFEVQGDGPHDITALGNRLYTSSFGGFTGIYDVENMSPTSPPELIGTVSSGASSHSNWVTDDEQVLVSARERSNGDITIFDISDVTDAQALSRIRRFDIGIQAFSPHNPLIDGDILYVSWYQAGLQMFDISDPSNPIHLGGFDTFDGPSFQGFNGAWGVYPFLGEDRVLVGDTASGLMIFDVSAVVPEPTGIALMSALGLTWLTRRAT